MLNINLVFAFLLEIVAFLGFAAIGLLLPIDTFLQIISAIILFVSLVIFWSQFMSPRAPKKVNLAAYYFIKFVIYAVATYAIFHLYEQFASLLFFAAFILNDGLLFHHNKRQF